MVVDLLEGEQVHEDGLATDGDARVLDQSGTPIQGLYAVGNDMASLFRGVYVGPGITLGPALVFAYRAVMHLASKASADAGDALVRARLLGPGAGEELGELLAGHGWDGGYRVAVR